MVNFNYVFCLFVYDPLLMKLSMIANIMIVQLFDTKGHMNRKVIKVNKGHNMGQVH